MLRNTLPQYFAYAIFVEMDQPPPVWKLTIFSRSMHDFGFMLESEHAGPFFRNLETIRDLHEEQKRLTRRINLLYAVTFIGALLVLSGPLPQEAKISAFGIEAPLGAIPQQVIAVMMAVAYSMYGTLFASFLILTSMIGRVLQAEGWEGWQFFSARFDASFLWGTLLTPRSVGYSSPRRHRLVAFVIVIVSFLSVVAHTLVILTAAVIAFWTALEKDTWLLAIFGGFSTLIVMVTIAAIFAVDRIAAAVQVQKLGIQVHR